MNKQVKNGLYTIVLLITVFLVWYYRNSGEGTNYWQFSGTTMGTTYNISYVGGEVSGIKEKIDSLLIDFNQVVSTYEPESDISRFNRSDSFKINKTFMLPLLQESKRIFDLTNGSFDPTVMPLVDHWGFGPGEKGESDSLVIDSLMHFIGYNLIDFDENTMKKKVSGVELDFSAIAKGYGVDLVAEYLKSAGIENFFIEIGGEVRVFGKNKDGNNWKIGITHPLSNNGNIDLYGILEVENQSVATSGNYFNYYIENGVRYSHTIDPSTGYPITQKILSASIITADCMTADALATAAMVMGHDKSIKLIENNAEIEGILLFSNENGEVERYVSEGLKDRFEIVIKE